MSKLKSKLNQESPEIIEEAFLKESSEALDHLPDALTGIVGMRHIPEYKKVIFQNGRDPGVALHFHYSSKTHPLKHYTLYHGLEHELPVEIIEHLESCAETTYGWRKDRQGFPESYPSGRKYIFSFRSAAQQRRAA